MTIDVLRDSFYALKRQAAAGVDGVTWKEYEDGLEGRLADLHNRIHRGTLPGECGLLNDGLNRCEVVGVIVADHVVQDGF
jgi:RNA-directed DNA polymerase